MSTQLNAQEQNEKAAAAIQQPNSAASVGTSHLSSMSVSTTALLSALQAPSGAVGNDYSILSFILSEDESEQVQKTQAKQDFSLEQLTSKVSADDSDAAGATKGTGTSGKNAIAESAEMMSLLQNKAQNNMSKELQEEQELLEDELKAAKAQEELWQKFIDDWTAYQKDPNNTNFQALMQDIEGIYGKDSTQGQQAQKDAQEAQKAWDKEQHWQNESGWDRFKSGQWWDPHDWRDFKDGVQGQLDKLVGVSVSTPGMFTLVLQDMETMVKTRVQDLTYQIQFLQIISEIMSGSGNAVVLMQALMNVMMQMGIANNTQSTSRNQIMNNMNIMQETHEENKIQKELDKMNEHHSGLFGWIEDLFKSIVKALENIGKTIGNFVTGHEKEAWKDFKQATGLNKIIDAVKQMFSGGFNNFVNGLENLVTDVVVGSMFGGLGFALLNTSFGKDLENAVKLVIDTVKAVVVSLSDLVLAGLAKSGLLDDMGIHTSASDFLSKAGDVWKKVAENPALQPVLQIVMVAIIIAAALSGQFYLAAFMAVLFVLTTTGALTDMTNAIAKAIANDMGGSEADKEKAKAIADAITIVIVTVASLGVGFAGSIDAAADIAADTAANVAKQTAETTAETAADSTEETASTLVDQTVDSTANSVENDSKSIFGKAKAMLQKLGEAIGPRAGAALTGFGTSVFSTNFGYDIAAASNSKHKKELEKWLTIIFDAVAIVASLAGGLGMMSTSMGTAVDNAVAKGFSKMAPDAMMKFLSENSGALQEFASNLQKAALLVGGVTGVENGIYQVDQGEARKELQELMAAMTQLNVASDDLTRQMQGLTSEFKELTQANTQMNQDAYKAAAPGVEGVIKSLLGQV